MNGEGAQLEIGRIERSHGLHGDVLVRLVTNRIERLAPGSVLASDRGPLRVASAREHQGRFIVRFAEIVTREAADAARGVILRAAPIDDDDELWVSDLIGAEVSDQHGVAHGRVVSVQANPASDLLVLESGALVPVRFVISVEPQVRVVVDVPAGLLDDDAG